jgi:two-component system phosphate regulon sensor histidine kinase PhoR
MTPKQGIALASFIIAFIATVACWLLDETMTAGQLFVLSFLVFVVSLLVIYGYTKRYLSDKLLPIYRTMFGMSNKQFDLTGDPILDAEKDASEWADQRIEEIRDLQAKDDYRKEFIGNLAHELKTPLFNIQGYVNSLLEGAMEDERVREKFLGKANKNVDRMVRIIEDLDTISHLEFDRLELEKLPMDIVKCAHEVLESLERKAAERGVKLVMTQREPIFVLGDEFRLSQVLTNLVNNAITYGKEKGRVQIVFTDLTNRILIEVVDDGPGIDPAKLPRIFERFYRVDKSRSRDVGGSGLGLAIVKHILEAHEQTIRAKSTVGEGCRFSFTLDKTR